MMRVDDSLISMFHSTLTVGAKRNEPLVEVPNSELESGPLDEGQTYRIAVLGPVEDTNNSNTTPQVMKARQDGDQLTEDETAGYPVAEGDQVEVEIEDIGDEGDGIAKVNGYAVIVPDVDVGEEVSVKINHTTPSHAFAEKVKARH